MDLRFEVSPSEAGTVVDSLHAQGYSVQRPNRALGDELDTVTVAGVSDEAQEVVVELVRGLDHTARLLPPEE